MALDSELKYLLNSSVEPEVLEVLSVEELLLEEFCVCETISFNTLAASVVSPDERSLESEASAFFNGLASELLSAPSVPPSGGWGGGFLVM